MKRPSVAPAEPKTRTKEELERDFPGVNRGPPLLFWVVLLFQGAAITFMLRHFGLITFF
jgi:hypothetical protein